ncbi:MAG TPA: class I SAM-dependent methyltransferase, partial [Syntrophomonadaceae bacterium]|nr:class I SAM-dependent methyltransferase [Syntrophomonadaceae bacterium]
FIDLNTYKGLTWHEDFIVHLASIIRPRVYVELGIYHCALFNRIIPYAEQLIGVDINPEAGMYMQQSAKTRFVHAMTQEYVKQLEAESLQIDMLFIDADHGCDAVLQDFRAFLPYVAPHGLILMHDVHPGNEELIHPTWCGTAFLAAEELSRNTDEYEMMTIPVSPGLAICRKRKVQLSWQEKNQAGSKHFSIVGVCQVYNEMIKGNLERFAKYMKPLVDSLVVYDDGSTDGSYEYMLTQTPYVIRGVKNEFVNEISHKQILLEEALRLSPDFILWLDADEVLTANAANGLQALCAMCMENQVDGVVFHEINLWRSHTWRRLDSLYDVGWFVRLWRVTPGMHYEEPRPGLHQRPYPSTINKLQWADSVQVLHYGFSSPQRLAYKYLVYQSHGQSGYDMLDRLISEEHLVLEKVPAALFPEGLWAEEEKPVPLTWEESLAYVELFRSEVFKPQFSIICLIYRSVAWLKFVYEQVLKYTDMNGKEFFFVANDATDEVLSYLKDNGIPHYVFNNTPEQQAEWYVNNVYRAYNYAASKAQGDFLVFINSDMAFSPGWFDNLWKSFNGENCVTSRLVESGKLPSGLYGIERNFGNNPESYLEEEFLQYATSIAEPRLENAGLFMPLLIRKQHFDMVGGYPEGQVMIGSDIYNPVIARWGEACVSGDTVLMQKLRHRGIAHQTAFDSIVYHFQWGEKDS